MEDDEDIQSSPSQPPVTVASTGSQPESPPHANGLNDDDDDDDEKEEKQHKPPPPPPVTVAAPPTHAAVAVGIPIHKAKAAAAAAAAGGGVGPSGGREDCWSEGATWALIDAWGERFRELARGNLKQKDWQEVADIVSSRDDYTKPPKTDAQCKNRIDTLKKKYKIEKSKTATGSSSWPFFRRLDDLVTNNPHSKTPTPPPPPAAASADDSKPPLLLGFGSFRHQLQQLQMKKKRTTKKRSHRQLLQRPPSFPTPLSQRSPETSDSLPPETKANGKEEKKRRFGGADPGLGTAAPAASGLRRGSGGADEGLRELTRAITKFGEVYERVESTKLQQTVEMERKRMRLAKELELQRMDFFMKTLLELTQLKLRNGGDAGGHRRASAVADADDDKNHKDSTNNNNSRHHNDDNSGVHDQENKELELQPSP